MDEWRDVWIEGQFKFHKAVKLSIIQMTSSNDALDICAKAGSIHPLLHSFSLTPKQHAHSPFYMGSREYI